MKLCDEYVMPTTVSGVLDALNDVPGGSSIVAGGTDMLLEIQQGHAKPVGRLVDVSAVGEMTTIEIVDGYVYVGAAATHKQIISNPILQYHAQCLVEGCGVIGGPQVRNVATIGGNVAHALPAGDGTISLLALDAEVQIASSDGVRWEKLYDIFSGPGKVTFNRATEFIVGFRFPVKAEGVGSGFHRTMRPQGVAIAILNTAVWVQRGAGNTIQDVHISMGPGGPRPFRGWKTEEFLKGKVFNQETIAAAGEVLLAEVRFRTSAHRSTKEYREHLAPMLLEKVLTKAYQRAGEDVGVTA